MLIQQSVFAQTKLNQGNSTTGYSQWQYVLVTATGTWTCPNGVGTIEVECIAGGGSGGSSSGTSSGRGAGGQGGGYAWKPVTVTAGTVYTVTVGAQQSTAATIGNDSWFGSTGTILAKGGAAGVTGASAAATAAARVTTGGVGNQLQYGGQGGNAGATNSGAGGGSANANADGGNASLNTAGGGASGWSVVGSGAAGVSGGSAGGAGVAPGGGGGGASSNNTSTRAGGAGARGEVRIEVPTTHLGFF